MRKSYLLLAVLSGLIFIYSAYHLKDQFETLKPNLAINAKGFEDENANDEYTKLVDRFRQNIHKMNDEEHKDQNVYFWLSFLVTGLTASSTLVSAIQAAKKDSTNPGNSKNYAIAIAIIAFCSTLANFASTHYNELKTDAAKKATDLTNLRNQFFIDYEKATADGKPLVIHTYEQKLD